MGGHSACAVRRMQGGCAPAGGRSAGPRGEHGGPSTLCGVQHGRLLQQQPCLLSPVQQCGGGAAASKALCCRGAAEEQGTAGGEHRVSCVQGPLPPARREAPRSRRGMWAASLAVGKCGLAAPGSEAFKLVAAVVRCHHLAEQQPLWPARPPLPLGQGAGRSNTEAEARMEAPPPPLCLPLITLHNHSTSAGVPVTTVHTTETDCAFHASTSSKPTAAPTLTQHGA